MLSLIDVTMQSLRSRRCKRVGVLASPTSIRSGLFEDALEKTGISIVEPSIAQQKRIEKLIRQTMAGDTPALSELQYEVGLLVDQGAELVILGCTELSVIAAQGTVDRAIDPLDVVVDKLVGEKSHGA